MIRIKRGNDIIGTFEFETEEEIKKQKIPDVRGRIVRAGEKSHQEKQEHKDIKMNIHHIKLPDPEPISDNDIENDLDNKAISSEDIKDALSKTPDISKDDTKMVYDCSSNFIESEEKKSKDEISSEVDKSSDSSEDNFKKIYSEYEDEYGDIVGGVEKIKKNKIKDMY